MPGPTGSAAAVVAKVRDVVRRAGAKPGARGDTYEAAVFLLASRWLGQNVDRLARVTGVSGAQAARYARRLYDNGVWHEGGLVRSWDDDLLEAETFWADVLVARGLAHRRGTAERLLEWAPVGSWWKSGEASVDSDSMPATNDYQARVDVEVRDDVAEFDEESDGATELPGDAAPMEDSAETAGSGRAADLFPRADWLR